jgi:hypothetical protein
MKAIPDNLFMQTRQWKCHVGWNKISLWNVDSMCGTDNDQTVPWYSTFKTDYFLISLQTSKLHVFEFGLQQHGPTL